MAIPKEKNTVSYSFEGEEDDGVIENLIRDALIKLYFYQKLFTEKRILKYSHKSTSIISF